MMLLKELSAVDYVLAEDSYILSYTGSLRKGISLIERKRRKTKTSRLQPYRKKRKDETKESA